MKSSVVVLVGVLGCGPGLTQPESKIEGRNALLGASHDAKAIEELFQGSVMNGGLWFDDPACAATFANGGEIAPDQLGAFARCLVGLHLQASAREDELGDVVVMSYPPGIEIEARVVHETSGAHLSWIGYESRRDVDALIPTITTEAFESIRLGGDRNGPIDPEVAATLGVGPGTEPANAWLRVCVDETGTVTLAHTFTTTDSKASAAFEKAAMAWTFKPFMIGNRVVPICSMVRMTYPTGGLPAVEMLPLPPARSKKSKAEAVVLSGAHATKMTEGRRISGTKNIAPDDETKTLIQRSRYDKVTGTFRVCLDEAGNVESIVPLRSTGYASYDRKLTAGILTWKYSPYLVDGEAVPVCTGVTFIYGQS